MSTIREQWLVIAVDSSSEISAVILITLLPGYKTGMNYKFYSQICRNSHSSVFTVIT